MRVAAVIFDMDGLMLDTETPVQQCCRDAATGMGFDLDDGFYVSSLLGRGWADCDAALVAHFGPGFSLTEFGARFQAQWSAVLAAGSIAVKPGLPELLTFLRSRRIPTAIATSTHADAAEQSLRAAGVCERFDVFVTGDQVRSGKPHPEIYLTAAARLGVEPGSCVALEDSSPGVLAASRAGMTTLMVPDGGRGATAEAMSAAFQVLPSLHDVRHLLEGWLVSET
jgi:HAD superfamily hydrolase (TIGR01509 family)